MKNRRKEKESKKENRTENNKTSRMVVKKLTISLSAWKV